MRKFGTRPGEDQQERKSVDKNKKRRKKNAGRNTEDTREQKKGNRQIMITTYCVVAVFLGMIAYLTYFMVYKSSDVINNPYNKRQEVLAEKVTRGSIYSADGKVLAETVTDDNGNQYRYYPYKNMFCHSIGRIKNSMTGVELSQCYPLLTSHSNPLKQLLSTLKGEKKSGDNVITTLDADLTETAYNALGNYKGAVIAMEPSTGKILAMVSKPDYNPNTVEENWDSLVEDSQEESALLNRATQGLYPPGSTFKIMTAMEYIIENPDDYKEYSYDCDGSDSFEGNVINCYHKEKHGALGLTTSFAKSCNGSFASIGMGLDVSSFRKLCQKFMFGKSLPVSFEYNKSSFYLNENSDAGEITQTSIGQGKTMITPLENAMIVSTLANDGEMMIPYIVDHTENDAGQTVKSYSPQSNGKLVNEDVTKMMKKMMKAVVNEGTASSLSSLSYQVAGKTGSAEVDSAGTTHAWFVGYAPANDPKIAVSIVVEGAGTGSQYAVPIAGKMFEEYLGS